MKSINEIILFLAFLLISVLLNTVGAEHLISKKKLEEKDTKTKVEKVIFTVLSVVFTNATTAFLIYQEKNMPKHGYNKYTVDPVNVRKTP